MIKRQKSNIDMYNIAGGRPSSCDGIDFSKLVDNVRLRALCCDCFTYSEIIEEIENLRKQNISDNSIKPLNKKTYKKILKEIGLEEYISEEKNERRILARRDLLNHINIASIYNAILFRGDQKNENNMSINPHLIFNIDETSFLLENTNNKKEKAVLSIADKKQLAKEGLSVSISSKRKSNNDSGSDGWYSSNSKRRSIHMHAVTSASGHLHSVVVEIGDTKIEKIEILKVILN
jgi:hypothetical protein